MLSSAQVQQWLSWDKSDAEKIRNLSETELTKIFDGRMAFGTAGLRANMGPGPTQMNDLTIIQTSQGLVEYAIQVFGLETLQNKGIVVGYDARYNSNNWAKILSNLATFKGIKVYTFKTITPTPWVPFSIRKYQAALGVMITASHNPKNDNGYKVYWDNGSQIIPPHDKNIAGSILKNLAPWDEVACWSKESYVNPDLILEKLDEVNASYFQALW